MTANRSSCAIRTQTSSRSGNSRTHTWHTITHVLFFQAEDGIRVRNVTGVQTCALPIWGEGVGEQVTAHRKSGRQLRRPDDARNGNFSAPGAGRQNRCAAVQRLSPAFDRNRLRGEIGRASCRESADVTGYGGTSSAQTYS